MKNRKAEELLSYLCCSGGRAVRKRMLEELMWAEAERGKARDSLYKVCAFLNGWQKREEVELPLVIYREEIYLDTELIELDLQEFIKYLDSENVEDWERAERIYTAPLLFENSYEWVEEYEAVYDMAYYEVLCRLLAHYEKQGNQEKTIYYSRKLKGFR